MSVRGCRPGAFCQSTVLLHPSEAVMGVEARARKEVRTSFTEVGPGPANSQPLELSDAPEKDRPMGCKRRPNSCWKYPAEKGSFVPMSIQEQPPTIPVQVQKGTFVSWRQFRSRMARPRRQMPSAGAASVCLAPPRQSSNVILTKFALTYCSY